MNVLSEPLQLNDSLLKSELTIAKHMLAASRAPAKELQDVLNLLSDNGSFHNLRLCMRAALTLPVSSASCERSFSTLKYIKNYLRSTMCDERLNALSLLYVSQARTASIDPITVVDALADAHQRAVQFRL